VAAALQIWSPTFSKAFDSLPESARDAVRRKVDDVGRQLEDFPHQRLQGRSEFKDKGLERSRVLMPSNCAQLESSTFRFRDPLYKERLFLPCSTTLFSIKDLPGAR
jgi:hypothetical protein